MQNNFQLVLGSQSPRRKELLSHLGIPFTIQPSHIEEHSDEVDPQQIVEDLSRQKGKAVWAEVDKSINPFVVTSDTIVCLGDKIYGKPVDEADSRKILSELSGNTHRVITAISVFYQKDEQVIERTISVQTMVKFREISNAMMDIYVSTGDGADKAGSYGIQSEGLIFIEKVEGSYSNVVGFPLDHFIALLRAEFDVDGMVDSWRDQFSD